MKPQNKYCTKKTFVITLVPIMAAAMAFAVYAVRVTTGRVVVTNPGSSTTTGSGRVWVQWDYTQSSLYGTATWSLKKGDVTSDPLNIGDMNPLAPGGDYTLVLSPCSVAGYTAPSTSGKGVKVAANQLTLVTVRYRH